MLVIYYIRVKRLSAGLITLTFNRLGDVFILLSIRVIFRNIEFINLFFFNLFNNKFLVLLIILASITKSAQIPFSR